MTWWIPSEKRSSIKCRGGVKSEIVQNLFDSIQNFVIRLIQKEKNWMKINLKFVGFSLTQWKFQNVSATQILREMYL